MERKKYIARVRELLRLGSGVRVHENTEERDESKEPGTITKRGGEGCG